MTSSAASPLLCDARDVITVENPSFVDATHETQFDTIYHEHFSYLSAHAVAARRRRGTACELVRVEELTTHGGSYRYRIVPQGSQAGRTTSVASAIERELSGGPALADDLERVRPRAAAPRSPGSAPGWTSARPRASASRATAPPPRATRC